MRAPQPVIRNPLATFVFVQVLALAAIVLFASAIPLIVWRRAALSGVDQAAASAPIVWLALPVAVAVVAAYYVSTLITRRFVHALAEVEQSRT
jgi:heme exporter protein D